MRSILCHKAGPSHLSPVLAYYFLSRCKFSTLTRSPSKSNIISRLYAQNPVFEIVHQESVKVYLNIYNGNVQQNPLCAASCVTKDLRISPRSTPTIFNCDANSVLVRAHLHTAVLMGSMHRTLLCSKLFIRRTWRSIYTSYMYNGNVQQNPLRAASCVTKDIAISRRFSLTNFYRRANSVLYSGQFLTHSRPN